MAGEKVASSYTEMRRSFLEEINKAFEKCDISCIKVKWHSLEAKDSDKRAALEQALRDKTMGLMTKSINDSFILPKFLNLVMNLCKQELAYPVLSVTLLSDILDSATIPTCEKLFEFVEGHVSTWKAPIFFGSCKNNILRMCNDLLRRLSKAQNTVFCGRILLFLAMFFPFSERSGLNVVSDFNTDKDNFMKYEVDFDDPEDEPLQAAETPVNLDSNFYAQFWALQEFFRSPTLCYNDRQWKEFVKDTDAVLTVFKNYKLQWEPSSVELDKKNKMFFTKFLTNQKLLLLQLSDTDFRRTIYIQFLILFQFLSTQIKVKQEELRSDQLDWVKSATATVHQLIKESTPDGEMFFEVVQLIMKREEHWSQWKNDGCPALKKKMPNYDKNAIPKQPDVPETVASVLASQKSTNLLIVPRKKGEEEVTEIVDMRQNYLQYLPGRNASPDVNEFLAEAIQQSESDKSKDKKVNDPQFSWIALKLLSMKSPHFFSITQTLSSRKLPDFVDHICGRIFRGQNPGLLLPPLMPATKLIAKTEGKKAIVDRGTARSSEVNKTLKNQVKVVKTASGKNVKVDVTTAPSKVVTTSEIKSAGFTRSDLKSEKSVKVNDKYDKAERYEKTERYDKGRSEKLEKTSSLDKQVKPEKAASREKSSEKKIDATNNKPVNAKAVGLEKERAASRKEREKSPGKRKREELDSTANKKSSRDKRDDRRDDKDAPSLTSDQIEKLSKSISGSWKKLAEKLGYKTDEIEYFTTKKDNDFDRALNLLLVWASNEEDATPENLYRCLKSLNLTEAMKVLV